MVTFPLGTFAKKSYHANEAATIREIQAPSDELTAVEWSWCDATCYLVHSSHGIYVHAIQRHGFKLITQPVINFLQFCWIFNGHVESPNKSLIIIKWYKPLLIVKYQNNPLVTESLPAKLSHEQGIACRQPLKWKVGCTGSIYLPPSVYFSCGIHDFLLFEMNARL